MTPPASRGRWRRRRARSPLRAGCPSTPASAAAGRRQAARRRRRCGSSCSCGVSPSCDGADMPDRTWPRKPATRTMKNSSRLSAEIDRNRSCSRSGWLRFDASSSTRRLNCSQDNSRLMKRCGNCRSTAPSNSISGGAFGDGVSLTISALSNTRLARTSLSVVFRGVAVRFGADFVTVSRRGGAQGFHSISSIS